jgi:flavocytochrome c
MMMMMMMTISVVILMAAPVRSLLMSSTSSPPLTIGGAPFLLPDPLFPSGRIPEAHCNVEELEIANDSQLYSILQELKQTNFFRNFLVDLDTKCPLADTLGRKHKQDNHNTNNNNNHISPSLPNHQQSQTSTTITETLSSFNSFIPNTKQSLFTEEASCASEGIPDLDPDAEPACHVAMEDPITSSSSSAHSSSSSTSIDETKGSSLDESQHFECEGGKDLGLDDEDEPLCSLQHGDYTQSIRDFLGKALSSIRSMGWESESQRNTYQWTQNTNPVIFDKDSCDEHGKLPDEFWQDMCASITIGDSSKAINLLLNPERNTGYNGTHIWNAIYQENCLANSDLCYEERVLYRLLSGLHTSTSISITKHYFPPSKKKNRTHWEPNPTLFMKKFQNNPEHLRNLHFSYVVLLRALKKATNFFKNYEIQSGNIVEDELTTRLLARLLDSDILESCQSVFSAFDERLMFAGSESLAVQQNFKGVFHNISSIFDCVQCQQCKLHGKMSMLGYGAALKILFMTKTESYALSRNEIVAFVNTVAKFSEALRDVRELTNLYWKEASVQLPKSISSNQELGDAAIGLIASLARQGKINDVLELKLAELALQRNDNLMLLVKHYGTEVDKFITLASKLIEEPLNDIPDAIIVGSGLAGLSAALQLLDRGGTVTIVEKEHILGGNSNKASSGINACCPNDDTYGDFLEAFRNDTIRSAGSSAQPHLVDVLVNNSKTAVLWLKERVGVDLSLLAQLGGHSYKRTHRPYNGMAGAEIVYGVQKAVKGYQKEGKVKILVDTRVQSLITDANTGRVIGVQAEDKNGQILTLYASNVVLATGGFAADRSHGSYLDQYRPELMNMPATAGSFSTGDGVALATKLGAGTIDMEKVQIHPTGWVDPKDPQNVNKILAAELMRGVGGILINSKGKRFCNELGTRAYVTDQMLSHDSYYVEHRQWNRSHPIPTFSLVLSSAAASDGSKHVDHYAHKGLLLRLEGIQALADWMHQDASVLRETFNRYIQSAATGRDEFGKVSFRGLPDPDLDHEVFYAGTVTPVLHYCMGGITINAEGNVLTEDGKVIDGLYAAGEVTGGVHGDNRLGGNSLLECTVFGSIIGQKLPIKAKQYRSLSAMDATIMKVPSKELRNVTMDEVVEHNHKGDCWVVIHGIVYDLTEFADEHPGGAHSIQILAGKDGTDPFAAVHNNEIMDDFVEERIGILV